MERTAAVQGRSEASPAGRASRPGDRPRGPAEGLRRPDGPRRPRPPGGPRRQRGRARPERVRQVDPASHPGRAAAAHLGRGLRTRLQPPEGDPPAARPGRVPRTRAAALPGPEPPREPAAGGGAPRDRCRGGRASDRRAAGRGRNERPRRGPGGRAIRGDEAADRHLPSGAARAAPAPARRARRPPRSRRPATARAPDRRGRWPHAACWSVTTAGRPRKPPTSCWSSDDPVRGAPAQGPAGGAPDAPLTSRDGSIRGHRVRHLSLRARPHQPGRRAGGRCPGADAAVRSAPRDQPALRRRARGGRLRPDPARSGRSHRPLRGEGERAGRSTWSSSS